jgi:N-acetylglucosamine kinase-like BadF-type ATPase
MNDRRPVGILGGHSQLLGDEGSGFWIGRQAVRAALRDIDDGVALRDVDADGRCAGRFDRQDRTTRIAHHELVR